MTLAATTRQRPFSTACGALFSARSGDDVVAAFSLGRGVPLVSLSLPVSSRAPQETATPRPFGIPDLPGLAGRYDVVCRKGKESK